LPTIGIGALVERDDVNLLGTSQEHVLFGPQDSYYQVLGSRASEACTSIDCFVAGNSYTDQATIGTMCRFSAGQMFYYPGFSGYTHGFNLESDLYRLLTRETYFDCVATLRVSSGLQVADVYGNFLMKDKGEIELASIDCDKTLAFRIALERKLEGEKSSTFQLAVLYTTAEGKRYIRVHTQNLPITTSLSQIFRVADVDALVSLSIRQVINLLHRDSIVDARKALRDAAVDILYTYRRRCASTTSSGQLILPEALKLLPLYTLGILKNPLLRDFVPSDERNYAFHCSTMMPLSVCTPFYNPRIFCLSDMPSEVAVRSPII
jgi:protein transport protein SEC24